MRALTVATLFASVALSACSVTGSGEPPAAAVAAKPAAPSISGVMAGAFGADLAEADRQRAFDAQTQALETGKRQSWRGDKGQFGYVEPGAESRLGGSCRDYTHTLYLAGRPKTANGSACRQADGSWRANG